MWSDPWMRPQREQTILNTRPCRYLAGLCALLPAALACANDGLLDTRFGNNGKAVVFFDAGGSDADGASAAVIQPDGRIVVAGTVAFDIGFGEILAIGVTRLLADGVLDTTFGSGGRTVLFSGGGDQVATTIALQPDGGILIGGWFQPFNEDADMLVYRLTANGNTDPGFGVSGKAVIPFAPTDDVLTALALQPDGRIVGAGYWYDFGIDTDFAVVRLNADGSLDTSFGVLGENAFAFNAGGGNTDYARAVTLDRQGSIVLAGAATASATGTDFAAVRFTSAGAVDASFGNGGGVRLPFSGSEDAALGVALSYDGEQPRYTLAGYRQFSATDYDYAAVQLDQSGAVAPAFGMHSYAIDLNGTGADFGTAIVADNNAPFSDSPTFTIAGYAFNGTSVNYDFAVIRVLANGLLDPDFGVSGKTTIPFDLDVSPPSSHDDLGFAIALQAHRPLIAGLIGRQGHNGADTDFGITRLTADHLFADGFDR